jgi:hypothetical protein
LAYLGWLRGVETFGLTWADIQVVEPLDGPTQGLFTGIGVVLVKLLPQAKSSQSATADVVLAYQTASGLCLGHWLRRLRSLLPPSHLQPTSYVLAHVTGQPWTSHYYRYSFFYPALYLLRALGNPYLGKYDESPGRELTKAIWSFNTIRRTARTVVAKKRAETRRKASPLETVEHGCWRIHRSSLDMPLAYLEMSIEDRLCINLFCQ